MPGLDRRGPMGNGSMTGGGRGLCNAGHPLSTTGRSDIFGNGTWRRRGMRVYDDVCMGMGRRGGGRRERLRSLSPLTEKKGKTEIETLKKQAKAAEETLDIINKKLDEIEQNFWQIH